MKKLSILIFAILMLGCETETPVVEEPLSVIEAPSPIAASTEHFWVDIVGLHIEGADIADGANDVDPEPLNQAGIRFWVNEDLKLYNIDLRHHEGESLGWLPRGVVDDKDIGKVIRIMPAADSPLLEFDTLYVIHIFIQDFRCWTDDFRIVFLTKPKP